MKWFKHDTDASDDIKIKRLEEEFKNDGYAVFFKTLEVIGKEGVKGRISFEKYPKKWLSQQCHVSEEKIQEIYTKMAGIGLINRKSFNRGVLHIPNFAQRADNYSKYIRRDFEANSNQLNVEKNRIEKNRIDKIIEKFVELKGWSEITKDKKEMVNSIYKRHCRPAKELALISENNDGLAAMEWFAGVANKKNFNWTIETIIKWFPEWLKTERKSDALKSLEAKLGH